MYVSRLDCLFQGQVAVLSVMADLLQRFAVELMKRSTGLSSDDAKLPIPMQVTQRKIESIVTFPEFSIGSTPHKVMDVWRKERTFVQNHAILPLTAPAQGSELARQRSESEDWISGGFDEEVELGSNFWKERQMVHEIWLAEAEHNKQVSEEPGAIVATWRSNAHSNSCYCCSAPFGFLRRKHHCRRCGELVCSACSPRVGPALRLLDAPEDVNILLKKQVHPGSLSLSLSFSVYVKVFSCHFSLIY